MSLDMFLCESSRVQAIFTAIEQVSTNSPSDARDGRPSTGSGLTARGGGTLGSRVLTQCLALSLVECKQCRAVMPPHRPVVWGGGESPGLRGRHAGAHADGIDVHRDGFDPLM